MVQLRNKRYPSRNVLHMAYALRIQHHLVALNIKLQNLPLKRLVEQARGKVIENERVARLEERATRAVLGEIWALTRIAEAIPQKQQRPPLFHNVLPVLSQSLAFRGGDWSVCKATVQAMGTIWGDNQIVSLLQNILENHKEHVVRKAAAIELSNIGGTEAIAALIDSVGAKEQDVRQVVAGILELKEHRRCAVHALEQALQHCNPAVRSGCAVILEHIGWEAKTNEKIAWYLIAKQRWDDAVLLSDAAIAPLENVIRGKGSSVRDRAARALDTLGWKPSQFSLISWYIVAKKQWPEAVKLRISAAAALVNALDDEDSDVYEPAEASLEKMGADAVPALVNALAMSNVSLVLNRSALVLGRIARTSPEYDNKVIAPLLIEAIPVLTSALRDEHQNILLEPANALADIAENLSSTVKIGDLFDDPVKQIKSASKKQHAIVRQNLDAALMRILRAKRGASLRWVKR